MQKFEVRVEVPQKGSRHFSSHVAQYIEQKTVKMFHVDARTPQQAEQKARKKGRPISVRKANMEKLGGNIETLMGKLASTNPYPDAVAMDEFVWRRKNKRAERINNSQKDKD